MTQPLRSTCILLCQPSAFLPLAMSLSATAVLVAFLLAHGTARQPDESAVAHIWQILIAGQLPIIAVFAFKWLPQAPRQSVPVLALQAGAILAGMAPVLYLNL